MKQCNDGQVTVQDDDTLATAPTITVATEHLPSDATTASFYVVADAAPAKDVEVILEFNYEAPNPAGSGTIDLFVDYVGVSNWARTSVTIAAGETFGAFTEDRTFSSAYRIATPPFVVPVTGTLKVKLVDGDNYDLGDPSASGLPTDLATPTNPLMTINVVGDNRVVESSELRFEVVASPAPAAPTNPTDPQSIPVTINVTQTGNFIAEDISLGTLVKTVNIPKTGINKGRTEFTVNLIDDTFPERENGLVTATLQSGTGFVIGDYSKTAKATIYDNDKLPLITIDNPNPVLESAGSVSFTLTALGVTQDTDLAVAFTTANESGDFLGTQTPITSPLEFRQIGGSGEYVTTLNVTLDDDDVVELSGAVSVTILEDTTYPFSYQLRAANKGIAIVNDDDAIPEASISSTYSAYKGMGLQISTNNELFVTLNNASTNTVKVGYTFADGTATNGSDYNGTSGILTFEPDQNTGFTPTTMAVPFGITHGGRYR